MLVLGIESSAHTFGVGIVKNGKVIANEKSMFKIGTTGMIPQEVAKFHIENANGVVQSALGKAGVKLADIDGIGYTKGPGMGYCLQIGQLVAKTLAVKLGIGITTVNHGIAHAEIAKRMSGLRDPVVLYVSGGNSQIIKLHGDKERRYGVLGETFDIGVGNMFDNFARKIKLNPAWGSMVDKTAEGGRYVELPYTVKGMDFAFTGLLTHAEKLIGRHSNKDLCFSLREVAFSMLCEATERALLLSGSRELCVCGGVAQSRRLREMLSFIAKEHRMRFGFTTNEFDADNGAMIAFVAERLLRKGMSVPLEKCNIEQRYRIDRAVVV